MLDRIKKVFSGGGDGNFSDDEYIEIDVGREEKENKVIVKLFVLRSYEESTEVLNAIREGYTIAIVDIKSLRQKDPIELKRAISKIKKTVDALEGNIAGFGENLVVVTPSFAKIAREAPKPAKEEKDFRAFD